MRDSLLNFGKSATTATATAVACPDILQFLGSANTVGLDEGISLTAIPSRDVADDEKVTLALSECATVDGTYKPVNTYNSTLGVAVAKGEPFKFAFPKTTKQYLKCTGMVTKGAADFAACTLDIYIAKG
jgi:hypothetical protein